MTRPNGGPVSVRHAMVDDAAAIAMLHVRTWRESYAGVLPPPVLASLSVEARRATWQRILAGDGAEAHAATVLVAQSDAGMLGFVSCGRQRDAELHGRGFAGEVSALYVAPGHQRRGVGTLLLAAAWQDLALRTLAPVALWTFRDNPTSRGFYEGHGGREIACRTVERDGTRVGEVAYGWEAPARPGPP